MHASNKQDETVHDGEPFDAMLLDETKPSNGDSVAEYVFRVKRHCS